MAAQDAGLAAKREEFFGNVWDHTVDPFQVQFDVRRPLSELELESLRAVVEAVGKDASDEKLSRLVQRLVQESPGDLMAMLLQLTGTTRTKIITDLRAQVAAEGLSIPSSYQGLVHSDGAWRLAGSYVARRLRTVLAPLLRGDVAGGLEALNQATYPGYIRQQRAKLQGHEAEARLAAILVACGLPFEPVEKAENPLCRDAQVAGVSFDLVVPTAAEPRMCVKATVHTSNIGQYGESKDALEVEEAKTRLAERFGTKRPAIVVLVDGIGFRSNSAGLNGVLAGADEFCQFRTIWKGAVVAASASGRRLEIEIDDAARARHGPFLARHKDAVVLLEHGTLQPGDYVEAGEARIRTR